MSPLSKFSAAYALLMPDNYIFDFFLGNGLNINPKLHGNVLNRIVVGKQYASAPVFKAFERISISVLRVLRSRVSSAIF